ncbi:type II toxin-antitoxin system VapC family toxin [Methylocaldum szegediense]|jgi:predicted nucleic acid-binding protein|uniref:Ribonuclease VapC n=1 Tax=Methylocaldum szegediense TaxID=73780 RepID=A0ABN8X7P2_9GAMM|nr:type II toxin-antitoxin system VapC family toxin [Methylocaldum szegediense]CAI8928237.1 Ribonuclease VapC [Methylocaldum szegediense]
MRVYFDSSAFAKRYIDEAGTAEELAWCERASELALSVVAIPELISAFCRLQREGRITETQYQIIKSDLMADIADALICDTTPQVVQYAVKTPESHLLRGMDAIHLGAALACAAEVFVSADARQCRAAEGLGFQVVAL